MRQCLVWLLIVIAGLTARIVNAQQFAGPESSVYRIVSADGQEQGVATLLNDKRGVFLTASHVVLNAQNQRISREGKQYKFKVLVRGNNIASAIDDWAILQVTDENWSVQLPLPSLNLVYDLPDASEFPDAVFLTSPETSSGFSAARWSEDQDSTTACNTDSVILAQTSKYDKGYSGAAVYVSSARKKGVFAITSRFMLEGGVEDSETAQFFARISKQIEREKTDDGPIPANVIRETIKSNVYIKILPIKCIIDQILIKSELKEKIFTTDDNPVVIDIGSYIVDIKNASLDAKTRKKKLVHTINAMTGSALSLVGIIKILDKFAEAFGKPDVTSMSLSYQLFVGISSASEKVYAANLPVAYMEAYGLMASASDFSPVILPSGGASQSLENFIEKNDAWLYTPQLKKIQFDVSSLPSSSLSSEVQVKLGQEFGGLLEDSDIANEMSPETKNIFAKSAIVFLARGLNGASLADEGKSAASKKMVWDGLAKLGGALKYTQFGMNAANRDFADRLTTAGEVLSNPDKTYVSQEAPSWIVPWVGGGSSSNMTGSSGIAPVNPEVRDFYLPASPQLKMNKMDTSPF